MRPVRCDSSSICSAVGTAIGQGHVYPVVFPGVHESQGNMRLPPGRKGSWAGRNEIRAVRSAESS